MKIEVRKSYRTRGGERVKITSKDNDYSYPYHGCNNVTYTSLGAEFVYVESVNDLIAEWTDTPEVGTLQEIGAQVGDVVDYCGPDTWCYKNGPFEIERVDSVGWFLIDGVTSHPDKPHWRIISRANQGHVREVSTRVVPNQCVIGHVEVTKYGKIWMRHVTTADELTAAIQTLTAIRDAMADYSDDASTVQAR